MTMKYLLKTALCLLLCALLSLPALAEEGEELTCGDYTYVLLEDGGARITDYDGEDAALTVPDELDGHAVREIGDAAFFYCVALTTVTLPEGLTTIGDSAFSGCDLTAVALPDSLTTIGDSAFFNCESLTSITLPEGLTSIGTNSFSSCDSLAKIDVSPDHPVFAQIDGVLYEKATKTLVCYPAGKEGDSFAVPDGILAIGDSAFSYCSSLTTVTLPEGLTSIGDEAFYFCNSLTAVTLPDGLTSIGDDAFSFCVSLTTVTLPKGLTSIGANPFISCDSLEKIDVSPDHPVFEQIDGVLYEKATKTLVCYPAGKEGDSFAVPDGILAIGDYAFYRCSFLTTITLPDGLTSIGNRAFDGCESLTTITLPDGLTTIGDGAFSNCSSLTTITLPDGLTSIGNEAFYDCYLLTTITLPDSVTSIGEDAFSECDILTLTVPRDSYARQYAIDNGLTYIYPDANAWLNA